MAEEHTGNVITQLKPLGLAQDTFLDDRTQRIHLGQ